jgi:hypothetical protein
MKCGDSKKTRKNGFPEYPFFIDAMVTATAAESEGRGFDSRRGF